MGSGFAKEFREKFPLAYNAYRLDYFDGSLKLGFVSTTIAQTFDSELILASGITQKFYGRDGKRYVDYDAVAQVIKTVMSLDVDEIVMPKIGAGLGGGDWEIIEKIITILNYRRPELKFVIYEL